MHPFTLLLALATPTTALVRGLAFDRLITIFLSAQDHTTASADPHLRALASHGVLLTRHYALTHPSQPNYLGAVAGDYFGLDHDRPVRVPINVSTVVDLLDGPGISWAGYMEGIPGTGFLAEGSDGGERMRGDERAGEWLYMRKHNPFASFDSITLNGSRLLNVLSMDDFSRAFSDRSLPQYAFVTPSLTHAGPPNTTLAASALWAHDFLAPLLAADAFPAHERTLIQLTFDEAATPDAPNRVATILLGNAVPAYLHGTVDDTIYSHYSALATVQYNWRLPHLGRFDVGANAFDVVLHLGGDDVINRDPPGVGRVNNSLSYPGPLASRISAQTPWPVPNLELRGVSGEGVARRVRNEWKYRYQLGDPCPYDGSGEMFDGENPPVGRGRQSEGGLSGL